MIVKIQLSVAGTSSALIYNKSRSVSFQTHNSNDVAYLEKSLHPDVKGFFRAKIIDQGVNLKLMTRVLDRNW